MRTLNEVVDFEQGPHERARRLLPWYVTGQADAEECAEIDAHLTACAECRAELESEQALSRRVAGLVIDVERGWIAVRDRIEVSAASSRTAGRQKNFWNGSMAGWLLGGQAAAIAALVFVIMATPQGSTTPQYRALGAAEARSGGNMIAVFQPEAREEELRELMKAVGARLVDGPTSTGGYVLHVPEERLLESTEMMRADPRIVLAEPLESGGPT